MTNAATETRTGTATSATRSWWVRLDTGAAERLSGRPADERRGPSAPRRAGVAEIRTPAEIELMAEAGRVAALALLCVGTWALLATTRLFETSWLDNAVAIAGGLGTLEELAEISTWAQLGQHGKPIILCNVAGYWDPLVTLFEHMRTEKFIREGLEVALDVVAGAEDVIPTFERRLKLTPGKAPAHPVIDKM